MNALVVVMVTGATGANELANQPEHSTVQSTHLHMPSMPISSASISISLSLFLDFISLFLFSVLVFFDFGFGFVLARSMLAISFGLTHFRHASQKWAPHATYER